MSSDQSTNALRSKEYHSAHLAFSRATIVQRAAEGRPILDLLHAYTTDVVLAERDRVALDEKEQR